MVDRGPLLTSAIIFYLSIGAAIFEVLEQPYWKQAAKNYKDKKTQLLKDFPCLGQEGLDKILQLCMETLVDLNVNRKIPVLKELNLQEPH